jgi:hypothetical protein
MRKPKSARPTYNNSIPDHILLANSVGTLTRAESLQPSASTVERAMCHDPIARAIINAWRPSLPIVEVR